MKPGADSQFFKLQFDSNWSMVDAILSSKVKVISKPKRGWRLILQFLTFGWYKASWYFKVELL